MNTTHALRLTAAAAAALVLMAGCGSDDETNGDDANDNGNGGSEEQVDPGDEGEGTGGDEGDAGGETYTMADVEGNADAESCWTVIDGTVYDVTDWISQHPGGAERIEGLCGTDGTDQFQGQHGGSSGPEGQLAEFAIGQLSE